MLMSPFRKRGNPHMLVVGMVGVKLGDAFAQMGCADGDRLAALARQVGLSGHAVAVVPDDASAARARRGAADLGVLVEIEIAPLTRLPLQDERFDVVVIDETEGQLAALTDSERTQAMGEASRILRPGGRMMIFGSAQRQGLSAWLARKPSGPILDLNALLTATGLRAARTLAEREGLIFVEGIKPR